MDELNCGGEVSSVSHAIGFLPGRDGEDVGWSCAFRFGSTEEHYIGTPSGIDGVSPRKMCSTKWSGSLLFIPDAIFGIPGGEEMKKFDDAEFEGDDG